MKKVLLIILLLVTYTNYSQNFPVITLNDKSSLKLDQLYVNAEISGNYATVTYDMTFYNGLNRVLEGELAFPLAQGQSVSHFAMDLNGKLRSAVVVEKELGRVAYENTIKQRIDPALLEQTQGNNYKARVYPIPAKGYKRIVITYEQNLLINDKNYQFEIPFGFKDSVNSFKIEIKSNNINSMPKVNESFCDDLKFIKTGTSLVAKHQINAINLDRNLKISFPTEDVFSLQTFNEYFHISKAFVPKNRLKTKPKSVTILWNASYSMYYKQAEKELILISDYLKYLNDVNVKLIVFSNTIINTKNFKINAGNSNQLLTFLKTVNYDGGTSYKSLPKIKSDEIILFSDGLHNLGEIELNKNSKLYCVNSVTSANHELLELLATKNDGKYINLNNESNASALSLIKSEAFQFIGVNHENTLYETYPKPKTVINEDFNFSGKYVQKKPIELLFGYGNEITLRIKVDMTSSATSKTVRRLWAKNKLKYLKINKEENKNKIIDLAKAYHLITPYTSMIVLDRLEDYVRYKIEPPAELLEAYNRRLSQSKVQQQNLLENIADRKDELKDDYDDLRDWYAKDFIVKREKKKRNTRSQKPRINTTSSSKIEITNERDNVVNNWPINNTVLDTTKNVIYGTITTLSDGLPLTFSKVVIKGTNTGTQTDFDGKYSINANEGDILLISYVGMITAEVIVTNLNTYNAALRESDLLEEVVVIGYATTTKQSFTSSASVVTSEQIESKDFSNISQSLAGEAAGVKVVSTSGLPGSSSTFRIRGFGTLSGHKAPLIIVDGIPFTGNSNDINPTDIKTTSILNATTANAIYGSRGAKGVIIITTKAGSLEDEANIKILNEKIIEVSTIKPWDKNASYIEYISEQSSTKASYEAYLKIRETYRSTPSFFLDVADFFETKDRIDLSLRIVTNLIEIDLDNHELIRALAYKLEQYKNYDLAVYVYKAILELRPEHPQSYRDLALAYEANGDFEASIDLFLNIVNGDLLNKDAQEIYYGIEKIAYVELSRLVNMHKGKRLKELRQTYKPIKTDIRVVVDWNHGETDLDLYITNPKGDVINYANKTSKYGGKLSEDMTDGYGPESFWIKKAIKGNYEISVDYYSDSVQKITGPASLKVTIYKNYGKSNEEKEIKVLRLNDNDSKRKVKTIAF